MLSSSVNGKGMPEPSVSLPAAYRDGSKEDAPEEPLGREAWRAAAPPMACSAWDMPFHCASRSAAATAAAVCCSAARLSAVRRAMALAVSACTAAASAAAALSFAVSSSTSASCRSRTKATVKFARASREEAT